MNIHFQQAEKKSQVFFPMLVVVLAFAVSMLVLNAVRPSDLHLAIHSSSAGQAAYGEMSNMPVAIPAPLPPAEQIQAAPVASSTPGPLPQAVAVPAPELP